MSETNDPTPLEVTNNTAEDQYEVRLDGKTALVQYRVMGKRIVFVHTEVPPEFKGMGIGNRMAQVALDDAQANGYEVEALCPFIAAYIGKHPEYQAITLGY